MSTIANAIFGLAQSTANSFGSGLAITIGKNGNVEVEFMSKSGTDKRIWEDHYRNVAFYLGDSANPVRWEIDVENVEDETVVNALDNAISTKYYETFMQNEALSRIFNISGPQQDLIIKLLYIMIAGLGLNLVMLLAMYGGG